MEYQSNSKINGYLIVFTTHLVGAFIIAILASHKHVISMRLHLAANCFILDYFGLMVTALSAINLRYNSKIS